MLQAKCLVLELAQTMISADATTHAAADLTMAHTLYFCIFEQMNTLSVTQSGLIYM